MSALVLGSVRLSVQVALRANQPNTPGGGFFSQKHCPHTDSPTSRYVLRLLFGPKPESAEPAVPRSLEDFRQGPVAKQIHAEVGMVRKGHEDLLQSFEWTMKLGWPSRACREHEFQELSRCRFLRPYSLR